MYALLLHHGFAAHVFYFITATIDPTPVYRKQSTLAEADSYKKSAWTASQKGCGLCKQPIESSKQGQWEVDTTGIVNWVDALTQL